MDHEPPRSHRPRSVVGAAALAVLAASVAFSLARPAVAASPCRDLEHPVIVVGSGKVIIADLAQSLSSLGTHVIYKLAPSCDAVGAILDGTSAAATGTPTGATTGKAAVYWTATEEAACDLDEEAHADIAISDVFASTCRMLSNDLPNTVRDFQGPIEAYNFVVPNRSTQQSISKAAAYFVFGFGKDSGLEPWTDEEFLFKRAESSGTLKMFAAALGVPSAQWRGKLLESSAAIAAAVSTSDQPEKTIGILTAEAAGLKRAELKVLAYQDTDQSCGYWPDSTSNGRDKQNVRDGHYALWGPLHLLTQVDSRGYPVSEDARDVIAYLTGTKSPPNKLDLISLFQNANIIPQCAMHVRRDKELGPLASFSPEQACGCYFDALASSGKNDCTHCQDGVTPCPMQNQHCNYGFCEFQ